jgi:hypothetical protein
MEEIGVGESQIHQGRDRGRISAGGHRRGGGRPHNRAAGMDVIAAPAVVGQRRRVGIPEGQEPRLAQVRRGVEKIVRLSSRALT